MLVQEMNEGEIEGKGSIGNQVQGAAAAAASPPPPGDQGVREGTKDLRQERQPTDRQEAGSEKVGGRWRLPVRQICPVAYKALKNLCGGCEKPPRRL